MRDFPCGHKYFECPGEPKCDAAIPFKGFAHAHCAVNDCIIPAEGGGGDDGRSFGGYTATECRDCGELICPDCEKLAPIWRDLTVCPDVCPFKGSAHIHCASFGCILWDEAAVVCSECGAKVCAGCARGSDGNGKRRCYDCTARRMPGIVLAALVA